jgi:prephenate dehydratase
MKQRPARPFDYHKPQESEIRRIESIRQAFQQCYDCLLDLTRDGAASGRYVSLACTALEEAAMWATKSVVFEVDNEDKPG